MKLIILIILAMFTLSGCNKSAQPSDAIVKIIDKCGDGSISISDIKGRKKSDGFMNAQVIGENSSSNYQVLEYRIVWLDKDGFKIESILSKWKSIPAYADQPFYINATSPSTKAKTFRLYIKRDKEVICDKQYDGY
ncbi:MAG: YcfL family protein [Sulfurimonas sp.]|uniref:YcfL family protein n=1 Tax=Sulfurimonas sp. TaxID=2022749 RepID=UPI00260848B9|nr:YcfL family protein [Sulfurimonas sp.]MCW8895241.1 YcfL family protein [Sulfurimonas sp.]MCW8953675.1 YcfL family protein [Sulfurimonas sp.]MCW9067592.1 YcfL family protein [Sulfurimonas sp.]